MHPALLVGIGAIAGSVGTKALLSEPAKKVYVKSLVCGMRLRDGVEQVIDEAKAEFDDVRAEAEYELIREDEEEAKEAKPKAAAKTTAKKPVARKSDK